MTEHVETARPSHLRGAGPARALPDSRAHEIVESYARTAPSAVAAVHGDTRWTYAELIDAADRVAVALRAEGLEDEDVVAVISHRSLDWLAAILGIFKAGGVYLPIDPGYPRERVLELLRRSGSRLALVEDRVPAELRQDLGTDVLPLAPVDSSPVPAEGAARTSVRVPEGALAYIYFTSGSTGAPKGAACEHAGMLNHLVAKVDVFGLEPETVVAQTASQSFDISLWQAVAPLLVGGTTVIVDPDLMLDVPALLELLSKENVSVLQLVPSYLDLLVTMLEQGAEAPAGLRMLGVTGEAVGLPLLARWFEQCPTVPVVNAYGATEASDDTTHEVVRAVSEGDRVTVGVPIANVFVDVVGPDGLPLDDDAVGEITFSGVCVGRGYINDPERTSEAFEEDPVRPGLRRYRSGDYGHWLSDGRLRFIGRRDEQVKISGVRVEVGEVEAQLLRVPGVRSACVVVVPDGASKRLAGFYTSAVPLAGVRDTLAQLLPHQMVPRTLRRMSELPLTDNGKVDKRGLADLEALAPADDVAAPATNTERRIAAAWAQVLGVPVHEIGRDDDFFARGGGSLASVRLVVELAGLIALVDLMNHPVLADLAAAVDGAREKTVPLLHAMTEPEGATTALVCVPYEAGNAMNFEAMARVLAESNVAVHAVELPGHDVVPASVGDQDRMAGIDVVAGRLSQEILDRITVPVALWGHGAGAALAVETARMLRKAGVEPQHLFLAAGAEEAVPGSVDVGEWLRGAGALADADMAWSARGDHIDRVFRHDLGESERYLDAVRDETGLPATIIRIPRAPGEGDTAARLATMVVESRTVRFEGAGRYFVRSHAVEAAGLVDEVLAAATDGGPR